MATTSQLLSIDTDQPVRVRERGQGGQGIDWTVQPENFGSLIEFINNSGGPGCWKITAAN
nr:MAG TPA: hypothetical protein [Caudoviricetes sp.]